MKIPFERFGVALVTAMFPFASLQADQIRVQPRISLGTSFYNLTVNDADTGAGVVDKIELDDFFYVAGGGVSIAQGRYFVDLAGQYSFAGDQAIDVDAVDGDNAINLVQDFDFDRIETNLTFGYQVSEQVAVFLGFRYADVNFDGQGNIDGVAADTEIEFIQYGPFAGGAYAFPTRILGGAFVANGALTVLKGDLTADIDGNEQDLNGNALGVNAGLSWSRPINDKFSLSLGADTTAYFGLVEDNEEFINRIRAELRYSFDFES